MWVANDGQSALAIGDLEDEVHVWTAIPAETRDPAQLADYRSWLSDEELERQGRFKKSSDRHLFLVAHGFVRSTLSRYLDIAPADWKFAIGEYGRPEIDHPGAPPLRFNLSHTVDRVVCGVTLAIDCGVDVEQSRRIAEPLKLAQRFFAPREREELAARTGEDLVVRFFQYWTLKEAYIKARGLGLQIPLDEFAFEIAGDDEIGIHFEASIDDQPECWQFDNWQPTPDHQVSVALRIGRGARRRVVLL